VMEKTGLPYSRAMTRLRKADHLVRDAIGEDAEPRLRALLAARESIGRSSGPPAGRPTRKLPAAPQG